MVSEEKLDISRGIGRKPIYGDSFEFGPEMPSRSGYPPEQKSTLLRDYLCEAALYRLISKLSFDTRQALLEMALQPAQD